MEPSEETPQLWWLNYMSSMRAHLWTPEERSIAKRILLIGTLMFSVIFLLISAVASAARVPDGAVLVVALPVAVFGGFYLSRQFCWACWPDLSRKADANAAVRLARNSSPGP